MIQRNQSDNKLSANKLAIFVHSQKVEIIESVDANLLWKGDEHVDIF